MILKLTHIYTHTLTTMSWKNAQKREKKLIKKCLTEVSFHIFNILLAEIIIRGEKWLINEVTCAWGYEFECWRWVYTMEYFALILGSKHLCPTYKEKLSAVNLLNLLLVNLICLFLYLCLPSYRQSLRRKIGMYFCFI